MRRVGSSAMFVEKLKHFQGCDLSVGAFSSVCCRLLMQSFRQSTRAFSRLCKKRRGLAALGGAELFRKKTALEPSLSSVSKRSAPLVAAFDCAPRGAAALCGVAGGAALPVLLYFTPRPTRALLNSGPDEEEEQAKEGGEELPVAKTKTGLFDDAADAYLHPRATR